MIEQRVADPITEALVRLDDGTWVLRSADGFEAAIVLPDPLSARVVEKVVAAAHAEIVRKRGH